MASSSELKSISLLRMKTVKILIEGKDWDSAAYMMGYALECAMKAVVCKTLNLVSYPENTRNNLTDNYFMTHKFDQSLTPSGWMIYLVREEIKMFLEIGQNLPRNIREIGLQ